MNKSEQSTQREQIDKPLKDLHKNLGALTAAYIDVRNTVGGGPKFLSNDEMESLRRKIVRLVEGKSYATGMAVLAAAMWGIIEDGGMLKRNDNTSSNAFSNI
jgi:hypothetical protein